jgi:hypothetical protein
LILLGASDPLLDYLDEKEVPFYPCSTLEMVLDYQGQHPGGRFALAYCEATFGWVVSRQLRKLHGMDKTLAIVEDGALYGDSDLICLQVANTLEVDAFLDVSKPAAIEWLRKLVSAD